MHSGEAGRPFLIFQNHLPLHCLSGNHCWIPLSPIKLHHVPVSRGGEISPGQHPFPAETSVLRRACICKNVIFNLPMKKKSMVVGEDLFATSLCSRTMHVTPRFNCLWSLQTPRIFCWLSGNSGLMLFSFHCSSNSLPVHYLLLLNWNFCLFYQDLVLSCSVSFPPGNSCRQDHISKSHFNKIFPNLRSSSCSSWPPCHTRLRHQAFSDPIRCRLHCWFLFLVTFVCFQVTVAMIE